MSLIYGLQTFLVYLIPSYLFFLRVWVERLDMKEHFDLLTIPLFIISGSGILLYVFLSFPIWNSNTLFHTLFYFFSFWILYITIRLKHFKIGFFNIFFYSTLGVFIVSELWEIPIILQSLSVHNSVFNFQHLFLAGLKLMSIPILFFYARKDFKFKQIQERKDFLIIEGNIIICCIIIAICLGLTSVFQLFNVWILIKIGLLLTLLSFFWSLKTK